jgi:hypothetical protein
VPVPAVELADDSQLATYRAATELAATPIELDTGTPWRARVATYRGEPYHLIAVIHHIAADNGGLRVLERRFRQALTGEPLDLATQPLDLALEQREEHGRDEAVAHWVNAWATLLQRDRYPHDASRRRRATVYSTTALAAVNDLSTRLNVSAQSVVLAAGALAVSRIKQRSQITLGLMAANRIDERWSELVSSLNQCAPLTVCVDDAADPVSFLRACYRDSLNAYLHGCFDVDVLTAQLAKVGFVESDVTFFGLHYNFLGAMDSEPPADTPMRRRIAWRPSTQRTGPYFHLAVAVGEGLMIGVGSSEDYLPGDFPARVAAGIEAVLMGLAEGAATALSDLRLDPVPGRSVDPEGGRPDASAR